MQSKHERAYNPADTSAAKRLRLNVSDLFAGNTVTGKRTQELLNDATQGGAVDCRPWQKRITTNTARDLRRKMLKNIQWPKLYEFEVSCQNLRTNTIQKQLVKVMLPSEVLSGILSRSERDLLYGRPEMDPKTLEHLEKTKLQSARR